MRDITGRADLDALLAAFYGRAFADPLLRQVFVDELAEPSRHYVVAVVDGDLAGYGGVMLVGEEAHITTVVVDPVHRQARIGTRLMLALVDLALEGDQAAAGGADRQRGVRLAQAHCRTL